jgi:hypothetical protein
MLISNAATFRAQSATWRSWRCRRTPQPDPFAQAGTAHTGVELLVNVLYTTLTRCVRMPPLAHACMHCLPSLPGLPWLTHLPDLSELPDLPCPITGKTRSIVSTEKRRSSWPPTLNYLTGSAPSIRPSFRRFSRSIQPLRYVGNMGNMGHARRVEGRTRMFLQRASGVSQVTADRHAAW